MQRALGDSAFVILRGQGEQADGARQRHVVAEVQRGDGGIGDVIRGVERKKPI